MDLDIVDRLRRKANHNISIAKLGGDQSPSLYVLLKEAADEIEALRATVRLDARRGK